MIKLDEVTIKLSIICAAGITLNVLGAFAAETLHSEIFYYCFNDKKFLKGNAL